MTESTFRFDAARLTGLAYVPLAMNLTVNTVNSWPQKNNRLMYHATTPAHEEALRVDGTTRSDASNVWIRRDARVESGLND